MKKLVAVLFAFTLVFSSVGSTLFFAGDTQVEAKSYKSGKKGYSNNKNDSNSNIQNKENENKNNTATNNSTNNSNKTDATKSSKGGFTAGGLMKGLFIGGLAGLLFGSLFSDLGVLGSILGFLVNAGAILLIVFLCIKIYQAVTRKKEKEAPQWKN
ncbi:hypothetical protein [Lysinibacillus sp. 54212]|uniref:hypothetical protein n=1 Tax=Lysinibacillus sp. 54212 TaxID=3119829 RepID=UPI002FCC2083